jgi:hypothetical protein
MSDSEPRKTDVGLRALCIDEPLVRLAKVEDLDNLYRHGGYIKAFVDALSTATYFTTKSILFDGDVENWRKAGKLDDRTKVNDLVCYLGGYIGWLVLLMLQEATRNATAEYNRRQEIGRRLLAEVVGQMYYSGSELATSELVKLRQRIRTTRPTRRHPYDASTPVGRGANATVDFFAKLYKLYPHLSLLTRIPRRLRILYIRLPDYVIDEPLFWLDEINVVNKLLGVPTSSDVSIALHLAGLIGAGAKSAFDDSFQLIGQANS